MHIVLDHPLIKDKLTRMRKIETPSMIFRHNLFEITQLIAYEATKNFEVVETKITTPVSPATGYKLKNNLVIVPILRAGLGMADAMVDLVPNSSVGFLGLYRNEESLETVMYYEKMPKNISSSDVIICDPMVATGNSIVFAINKVMAYKPKSVTVVGLVAAPEGLKKLKDAYPNIDVYVGALDEKLNDKGYIVPGLGDAGDRIFKTK